ncbi:MAG: isochorismatase family protein [Actinomycetota bacterium]|nr:isochorismatase family protein [Actinomycetota bacterium]
MTEKVNYQPDTALVVVDVQNDFADPEGSLYVTGGEEVVPVINREIRRAKEGGSPILYTQDWHPDSTPHFQKDGGVWPVHCVKGTWGAELHPDLEVDGPVVRKGSHGEDGYSGFTMRDPETGQEQPTELDDFLRARAIAVLVVVGLATDYCVKATALDGVDLGYRVSVLGEAVRAVNLEPQHGEQAIEEMRKTGAQVL